MTTEKWLTTTDNFPFVIQLYYGKGVKEALKFIFKNKFM